MKLVQKNPNKPNGGMRRGRKSAGLEFYGPDGTLYWHRRALIKCPSTNMLNHWNRL